MHAATANFQPPTSNIANAREAAWKGGELARYRQSTIWLGLRGGSSWCWRQIPNRYFPSPSFPTSYTRLLSNMEVRHLQSHPIPYTHTSLT